MWRFALVDLSWNRPYVGPRLFVQTMMQKRDADMEVFRFFAKILLEISIPNPQNFQTQRQKNTKSSK